MTHHLVLSVNPDDSDGENHQWRGAPGYISFIFCTRQFCTSLASYTTLIKLRSEWIFVKILLDFCQILSNYPTLSNMQCMSNAHKLTE